MYPLTCSNGDPHDFQTSENSEEYICTRCGISFDEYSKADDKVREVKEAIKKIAEYSNGGDADIFSEAMFQAMHETHRTIQQNFFRGLVKFIGKMADMPTDPRNKACVDWCKEASKIEAGFPLI